MPDYLWDETVACDVTAGDWREAITATGRLLIQAGCIEESYIEAMIRLVEMKGPYIVVAKGVALPHAGPENGAHKVGLAAVRLAQPVPFGHEANDPVDLLFCLCSPDFSSHIQALVGLTGLLENAAALAGLRAAPDKDAMLQVLNNNLF